MKEDQEILALTGLRFVAALYVFLFHMHIRWPLSDNWFVSNVLNQGAIGMSIFFLLSGFVLTYRYRDGTTSTRSYLLNRFARIYPVYVAAAVVTLPWFGVSLGSGSFEDVGLGLFRGALLLLSNIFLIQAWFPQFFPMWNVGASWSISVEAFCYVLLPFFLPALVKLSWKQLKGVAAVCIVLAALPGLSAKLFETPAAGIFYSLPIFRLPEFVLGCCVCLAWSRGRLKPLGTLAQVLVLSGFGLYLGIAGPTLPLYVGHNWIALPVIAVATLCLAYGKGAFAALLSTRPVVWLGKVSYCFYSFQVLIIVLLIGHHDRWVSRVPVLGNNLALAVTAFAVLLVLAAAAHHWIEEPARRAVKRHFASRATSSPLITGSTV